jgi:hypothetical protein
MDREPGLNFPLLPVHLYLNISWIAHSKIARFSRITRFSQSPLSTASR